MCFCPMSSRQKICFNCVRQDVLPETHETFDNNGVTSSYVALVEFLFPQKGVLSIQLEIASDRTMALPMLSKVRTSICKARGVALYTAKRTSHSVRLPVQRVLSQGLRGWLDRLARGSCADQKEADSRLLTDGRDLRQGLRQVDLSNCAVDRDEKTLDYLPSERR